MIQISFRKPLGPIERVAAAVAFFFVLAAPCVVTILIGGHPFAQGVMAILGFLLALLHAKGMASTKIVQSADEAAEYARTRFDEIKRGV